MRTVFHAQQRRLLDLTEGMDVQPLCVRTSARAGSASQYGAGSRPGTHHSWTSQVMKQHTLPGRSPPPGSPGYSPSAGSPASQWGGRGGGPWGGRAQSLPPPQTQAEEQQRLQELQEYWDVTRDMRPGTVPTGGGEGGEGGRGGEASSLTGRWCPCVCGRPDAEGAACGVLARVRGTAALVAACTRRHQCQAQPVGPDAGGPVPQCQRAQHHQQDLALQAALLAGPW